MKVQSEIEIDNLRFLLELYDTKNLEIIEPQLDNLRQAIQERDSDEFKEIFEFILNKSKKVAINWITHVYLNR